MGQMKPWQLILIVIGLLVCTGSVAMYVFGSPKVQTGTRIDLVDLATGDRWWIDVRGDRRGTFPAKHPETGERTLVRVYEDGGVWKSNEIGAAVNFVDRSKLVAVESFDQGTLKISDAAEKQFKPGG